MLHEANPDMFKIHAHLGRCLSLLREHNRREELTSLLIEAGDNAYARGAHDIAYQSFINVRALEGDIWETNKSRALTLAIRLAE